MIGEKSENKSATFAVVLATKFVGNAIKEKIIFAVHQPPSPRWFAISAARANGEPTGP